MLSLRAYEIFLSSLQLLPRFPTHTFLQSYQGAASLNIGYYFCIQIMSMNEVALCEPEQEENCVWVFGSSTAELGLDQQWVSSHGATNRGEAQHSVTPTSAPVVELGDFQSQQCHLFVFRKKSVDVFSPCMLTGEECSAHAVNDLQVWDKY